MEKAHSIHGVPGRLFIVKNAGVRADGCFDAQKWISEARQIPSEEWGTKCKVLMRVNIRYDDECGNRHNTFAITADIETVPRGRDVLACGCLHDEIAKYFPELAPLIRWHSVSADSPMHYVANTLYHAGNRDCFGRVAGEPISFEYGVRFENVPITNRIGKKFWDWLQTRASGEGKFRITPIAHENRPGDNYKFDPKYTLIGFDDIKWHQCPFDDKQQAQEFADALNSGKTEFVKIPTRFSEGKARDFDAARRAGLWPDATDAELSAPPEELKKALLARLPALIAEFRGVIEGAGMLWEPNGNY